MTFHVQALASGSSGNSTLVTHRSEGRDYALLIDAGLSAKATIAYLDGFGVATSALHGIVITHEHGDHIQCAHSLSKNYGIPLIANEKTLAAIYRDKAETPHHILPTGATWSVGEILVNTFPVPHDAADPVGISITSQTHKASFLTDLGSVTSQLLAAVRGSDLLVVEMNHCVHRLNSGPYPDFLKRRILSNSGHLSNETAVGFMVEHVSEKGPCSIWLAHLSKVNNRPKIALNYARATLKLETTCPFVIDVAHRDRPSVCWAPGRSNLQLNLF